MTAGVQQGSELARRLEDTFRLLGRRIYLPGLRNLRGANRGLERSGITLLTALEETDHARPSDLAASLELDLSTVSRQLRQLEELGLITRQADRDDGRASRISLTPQGRDGLAWVRADRAAMLDRVFHDWTDEQRRQLQTLLDRLLAGLAALPVPAPGADPPSDRPPGTHRTSHRTAPSHHATAQPSREKLS